MSVSERCSSGGQGSSTLGFGFFYLREAYTRLQADTLACLLGRPSMHLSEADISRHPDECDMPLAHLVRNVEWICLTYRTAFQGRDAGPRAKADNTEKWMRCVAAFAQAGVDPSLRDRQGKSALDYLGEHLALRGETPL